MMQNVDSDVYNSKINVSDRSVEFVSNLPVYQSRSVMIASVVATLQESGGSLQDVLDEFADVPGVEIGDVGPETRRIPLTIDSPVPDALEEITSRLQRCRGVSFVDVVFVHFEDESEDAAASFSGEMDHS